MGKQTAEELRREVLQADEKKDVSIYVAVPIGVLAGISSLAAVSSVIMMRAMEYFRQGIDAYWLSCVPFLFPMVTGLFAAYKKQFGLLGVHLVVTLMALLLGGFGFGLSVEPIFINRQRCIRAHPDVSCEKTSLSFLYLISGSVAAGFAVLGFLTTIGALYSATKRIAKRESQAQLQHLREQEEKQRELRQMRLHGDVKPRTLSTSSQPTSHPTSHNAAANGVAQVPQGQATNSKDTQNVDAVTTRL